MNSAPLLTRLGAGDLRLLHRFTLPPTASRRRRIGWIAVTQLGSAAVTIPSALIPWLLGVPLGPRRWTAALTLLCSHIAVQTIKRSVQRDRPTGTPIIPCPDRFSFPSGHSAAALSIALGLATMTPALTLPLLLTAFTVGWSRVVLGVHYPGDVLAGQSLALFAFIGIRYLAG